MNTKEIVHWVSQVKFYSGSEDLVAHLEKQPSQNANILLELIRENMERNR